MLVLIFYVILAIAARPVRVARKLRRLLSPLSGIKIPARRVTVVLNITVRFVPILKRRTRAVQVTRATQKTQFRDGGLARHTTDFLPLIVPIFLTTFHQTSRLTYTVRTENCHKPKQQAGGGGSLPGHGKGITVTTDTVFLVVRTFLRG